LIRRKRHCTGVLQHRDNITAIDHFSVRAIDGGTDHDIAAASDCRCLAVAPHQFQSVDRRIKVRHDHCILIRQIETNDTDQVSAAASGDNIAVIGADNVITVAAVQRVGCTVSCTFPIAIVSAA
jgi:hypothetical protein